MLTPPVAQRLVQPLVRPLAHRRYRMLQAAAVILLLGAGAFHGRPASAAGPLLLSATGADGTFHDKPTCWVTLQVDNPTSDEVTTFSGELRAVDAVSGTALKTVSLPVVGIAGGKLAPRSVGKPWPLNLQDTRCAPVAVRWSELLPVAGGRKCAPIAVEHKNVASITASKQ